MKISPLFVVLVTIALGIAGGVGFYRIGQLHGVQEQQSLTVKAGLAEWDKTGKFQFKGK